MSERGQSERLAGGQGEPRARSLLEKIWQTHVVASSSGPAWIAVDRIFLHERTGAIALEGLQQRGRRVHGPERVFCTIDHIVDTLPGRTDDTLVPGGRQFITRTRAAAHAAGIRLFDVTDRDQGIVHVISPELGLALPGLTIVCPDSHTCTQGAVGAFAWGIGSTEAEHALATGTLRLRKPPTLRVRFEGRLGAWVGAKDMSLRLLSLRGAAGGRGKAVEFAGSAVRALDMEARFTLCNMATEFSAVTAMISPDDTTFNYVEGRDFSPRGAVWDRALANWRRLASDEAAAFDEEVTIDVDDLAPMITWGTSPQHAVAVTGTVPEVEQSGTTSEAHARALQYMDLQPGQSLTSVGIDAAFIGSCTNGRLSDLRSAARVLAGRKIAAGVRALCVPGSSRVKREAEAEGLDRIFQAAGFEWRESGCSLCFYAGGEDLGLGRRVVSSTNRNFEGRQGPGTRTHIASPATVAASAVRGCLTDVRSLAAA
jgi:3-isopropylmalate/(R)-2-methylmalate dehydratase large subunit